ncbi:hypothetical protein [Halosolutus gelatinilyticus]|nr:hypothetical protein [Halosolutus gelatinilyticus]
MTELSTVLASDPALPMEIVGPGVLVLSLLVTLLWIAYFYR